MSITVFRQLGGAFAHRPRTPYSRMPTPHVKTGDARHFPPHPTLNPLYNSQNPLLPRIPRAFAPGPQAVDLGAQLSAFSPSSRPCLAN